VSPSWQTDPGRWAHTAINEPPTTTPQDEQAGEAKAGRDTGERRADESKPERKAMGVRQP